MACTVCLLGACKIEKKGHADIGGIDAEAGHITLTLSDDVAIDADITPKEDYEDGLAVYKGCWWQEDYSGFEEFSKNPSFWGKSIPEIVSLLEKYGVGNFTEESISDMQIMDDYGPEITLTGKDGNSVILWLSEMEDDPSKLDEPNLFYPWPENELQANKEMLLSVSDLDKWMDCSLTDTGIDIANGRKLVEELTQMAVSEHYLCIPAEEQGENAYVVFLFPDAGGFPVYREPVYVPCDDDAAMEELASERMYTENHISSILNLFYNPWCILYKDGEIAGLDIEPSAYVGDLYEEKAPVIGAEEIVEQVRNYFEKNYLSEAITITDITLAYNGYVSDGSNGKEIVHTVAPFWYVRYCDETREEYKSRCLLFNAFSGEFVIETGFLE